MYLQPLMTVAETVKTAAVSPLKPRRSGVQPPELIKLGTPFFGFDYCNIKDVMFVDVRSLGGTFFDEGCKRGAAGLAERRSGRLPDRHCKYVSTVLVHSATTSVSHTATRATFTNGVHPFFAFDYGESRCARIRQVSVSLLVRRERVRLLEEHHGRRHIRGPSRLLRAQYQERIVAGQLALEMMHQIR